LKGSLASVKRGRERDGGFFAAKGHNTTISQSGQNVTAETPDALPSTLKTVIIFRKYCRGWKFVFGRLFGLAGWILNTLSSNVFSDPFLTIF
jgi:hypothetical protein